MKGYWFNKKCCVPECSNCSTMGNGCSKEYFDLPAEPQARSRWLKAIMAEDGDDLKVCEDHFSEHAIFLDKNNKKKLKVNSTPSVMLSQLKCYDFISNEDQSVQKDSQNVNKKRPTPPNPAIQKRTRRSRFSWSKEERIVLFRLIKKYGQAKFTNNHIRINWNNVCKQSRNYNCFENEKDLKSAWQYLRIRAVKVTNNECLGTKLDRKVAKYISHLKGGSNFTMPDNDTSDDEFEESLIKDNKKKIDIDSDCLGTENLKSTENNKTASIEIQLQETMSVEVQTDDVENNKCAKNNVTNETNTDNIKIVENMNKESEIVCEDTVKDAIRKKDKLNRNIKTMAIEKTQNSLQSNINQNLTLNQTSNTELNEPELEEQDSGQESDSDNEYYSIADIEREFGIKISPETQVISLLSSDESDWE